MSQDPYRARRKAPACNGPVAPRDPEAVQRDIADLRAALQGKQPTEVFMTAVSPGTIAQFLHNAYYPSQEAYLEALGEAMKPEYRAITDAGFVLQLDCPDFTGLGEPVENGGLAEFRRKLDRRVKILNDALEGIGPDRLRMHL